MGVTSELVPSDSLVLYDLCLKECDCGAKQASITEDDCHSVSRGKGSLKSDATGLYGGSHHYNLTASLICLNRCSPLIFRVSPGSE